MKQFEVFWSVGESHDILYLNLDRMDQKYFHYFLNPIAIRKAKVVFNFGLSECTVFF